MAALCKRVTSEFYTLSRNILVTVSSKSLQQQGVRCLFAPSSLGIDSYLNARENVQVQFKNISEKFRIKMKEFTDSSSSSAMIFTEDLKNMIYLVESNPEDVDLIIRMMKRFNQQNKSLRFGNFVFGPVVMRMFHHLDLPEEAFNAFVDPELEGFFDQLISYQILLDLLFVHKMYDKVLEAFEAIRSKQIEGAKFPKNVVVLVLATLYKMNTPESCQKAVELWGELQKVGHIPMRRAVTFAAGLAINQNSPHIALEMLSGINRQNYVSVRNLKIAALADLGRPEDTFPLLRAVLESDNPQVKLTISQDSLGKVKDALTKLGKEDLQFEFEQLEKRVVSGEHIDSKPLDTLLCTEIVNFRGDADRERRFLAASFNRQRTGPQRSREDGPGMRPRPGLAEMY